MFRLNRKNTKRMIAAACLLVLFGFTSLYITYQNGTDLNAAHASSGNNESDGHTEKTFLYIVDYRWALLCTIAEEQARLACRASDDSPFCIEAKAYAHRICTIVP